MRTINKFLLYFSLLILSTINASAADIPMFGGLFSADEQLPPEAEKIWDKNAKKVTEAAENVATQEKAASDLTEKIRNQSTQGGKKDAQDLYKLYRNQLGPSKKELMKTHTSALQALKISNSDEIEKLQVKVTGLFKRWEKADRNKDYKKKKETQNLIDDVQSEVDARIKLGERIGGGINKLDSEKNVVNNLMSQSTYSIRDQNNNIKLNKDIASTKLPESGVVLKADISRSPLNPRGDALKVLSKQKATTEGTIGRMYKKAKETGNKAISSDEIKGLRKLLSQISNKIGGIEQVGEGEFAMKDAAKAGAFPSEYDNSKLASEILDKEKSHSQKIKQLGAIRSSSPVKTVRTVKAPKKQDRMNAATKIQRLYREKPSRNRR
ncbi:hypothetical protein HOD08_05235 [bacterium]|nr:hypothetical protein [bacterium]